MLVNRGSFVFRLQRTIDLKTSRFNLNRDVVLLLTALQQWMNGLVK